MINTLGMFIGMLLCMIAPSFTLYLIGFTLSMFFIIQATLQLPDIPDGTAQVEMLQSNDLNVANELNFHGAPHYRVQPQKMEMAVRDEKASLALQRYGVHVMKVSQ